MQLISGRQYRNPSPAGGGLGEVRLEVTGVVHALDVEQDAPERLRALCGTSVIADVPPAWPPARSRPVCRTCSALAR